VLRLLGEVAYIRTTAVGFKDRSISMRVSLYNARTHVRVPSVSDIDVAREQLAAPSDSGVVTIWIPCPPYSTKRYFVRVELYHNGDGILLAVADSQPFLAVNC
jgi:hypothetical protein